MSTTIGLLFFCWGQSGKCRTQVCCWYEAIVFHLSSNLLGLTRHSGQLFTLLVPNVCFASRNSCNATSGNGTFMLMFSNQANLCVCVWLYITADLKRWYQGKDWMLVSPALWQQSKSAISFSLFSSCRWNILLLISGFTCRKKSRKLDKNWVNICWSILDI